MNPAELQATKQTGDYDLMAPVEWSSAERELLADELSSIQGIFDSKAKRQCLNRRISHAATLRSEVAAWQQRRNEMKRPIDWQFTTDDARIKLRQLYPVELKEDLQIQS